jgi:hypothetical protein
MQQQAQGRAAENGTDCVKPTHTDFVIITEVDFGKPGIATRKGRNYLG